MLIGQLRVRLLSISDGADDALGEFVVLLTGTRVLDIGHDLGVGLLVAHKHRLSQVVRLDLGRRVRVEGIALAVLVELFASRNAWDVTQRLWLLPNLLLLPLD